MNIDMHKNIKKSLIQNLFNIISPFMTAVYHKHDVCLKKIAIFN